jgi:hypothetical protein
VGAGSCIAYNNCPSGSGYCTGEADQTITVSAASFTATQWLIAGSVYLNEVSATQYYIPGIGYLND